MAVPVLADAEQLDKKVLCERFLVLFTFAAVCVMLFYLWAKLSDISYF